MNEITSSFTATVEPWLLSHGIRILAIAAASLVLYKVSRTLISKAINITVVSDRHVSEVAERKRKDTLTKILALTVRIVIVVLGTLMILQEFGVAITTLLAGAGIVGIAVGFGGQYLVRDLISGFFLILENQYRIGDVVSFDGTSGLVEDISLRITTLRDLDGTVHHIPHGQIGKVSNLSKYYARVNLNIGISYQAELEHVIKVINNVGKDLAEDPHWKEDITSPPQFLRVDDFADSSVIVKILGETRPLKQWDVTGELRKRLKIAFDREGIEIPFPQRVVHQAP
jgi:moderate conductance mechanosensitive channel